MIADYAVILTIIMFVAFDNYYGLATPKLIVPTIFKVECIIQLKVLFTFRIPTIKPSYWFGFTRCVLLK